MKSDKPQRVNNEDLYNHSRELASKNKILLFLDKLYGIAVNVLDQKSLAEEISKALRDEFDFEIVGVYTYDRQKDLLTQLMLSVSDRVAAVIDMGSLGKDPYIASCLPIYKPVIVKGKVLYSEDFDSLPCNTPEEQAQCTEINETKFIKSTLTYPLVTGTDVTGVVIICLNRLYEGLVDYERDSIKSFVDVISIALNRAGLYEEIKHANQRLIELDKLKSEFVSIASHQLRSPLTVIRGYTSMILEGSFGKPTEKIKQAVEHIATSSQFMASSVEDYLNVSRIESGNMKYNFTDFNLWTEAEGIVDDLRRTALQKGLLLHCKSDLTKRGIVNADKGKTQQIIQNLLTNSIKYTPKGSITVLVHDDPKKGLIHVEVSDTGIGMSKETIESLFGKFVRAKNAHMVNVTGTGLGLFIAKEMAEKMKGSITAHSKGEGEGSTFIFTLPLMM